MYNVILADDEIWIRRGLIKKIDWQSMDLQLVYEAEDGEDALKKIKGKKPDILICDVRMPVINGLQLSKEARQLLPNLQILIISGYEDFNYAREAINFGALGYLLKPVDKEELRKYLEKAVSNIAERTKTKNINHNISDVSEKLLTDIVLHNSEYCINKANNWFQEQSGQKNEYMSAIVRIDENKQNNSEIKNKLDTKHSPGNKESKNIHFFLKDNSRIGILFLVRTDLHTSINIAVNRLFLNLKSTGIHEFKIGVGTVFSDFRFLKDSIAKAAKALEESEFESKKKIIYYKDEQRLYRDNYFPYKYLRDYLSAVETERRDRLPAILKDIEAFIKNNNRYSIKAIRRIFFTIVTEIMNLIMENISFDNEIIEEGYIFCDSINSYSKLEELKNFLLAFSQNAVSRLTQSRLGNTNSVILKAKDYIDNHYNQKLTLNKMAGISNMNPAYFCIKYKEIIGENYNEYLTKLRVEKAKQLLRDNNISISKIAVLVGYDDGRYFSKIFKKYAGTQPSNYKKQFQNENN